MADLAGLLPLSFTRLAFLSSDTGWQPGVYPLLPVPTSFSAFLLPSLSLLSPLQKKKKYLRQADLFSAFCSPFVGVHHHHHPSLPLAISIRIIAVVFACAFPSSAIPRCSGFQKRGKTRFTAEGQERKKRKIQLGCWSSFASSISISTPSFFSSV